MPLPTFIIPGAPKAGTTALWGYLNEHPQVCMARIKEPNFFTRYRGELQNGIVRPGAKRFVHFDKGIEWYESLYASCGNALARGEASTEYLSASDAAELIHEWVPGVKLIFLLRDPVSRLYSHYWQEYKLGWDELDDFERMVRNNDHGLDYYMGVSAYRSHLERYLSFFPRDRMLILLDSDLKKHPLETFREVCRFIGVSEDFVPSTMGENYNQQTLPRFRALEKMINRFRYSNLAKKIPDPYRFYLGKLRESLGRVTMVANRYSPMPSDLRSELIQRFQDDIAYVEELLGRKLDQWRTP
jgi:hypothetical protein